MTRLSRRSVLTVGAALILSPIAGGAFAAADTVEQWGLFEIALAGSATGNPFDIELAADFTSNGRTFHVPGFYDGDGVYKVRFSPDRAGDWQWRSVSPDYTLNGHTGAFCVTPPSARNHGPVRVSGGYHFAYADGTPFRQIGTTAYAWAQQSDARCDQTLASLAASPFNKIRMCVFPNVTAEPLIAFERTGPGDGDWDAARFNPAFFRRFEDRVARLQALGIEADIILFHPYDPKHGFSDMTRVQDERYIRYIVARLSAYRHVWWSMANEFDLIKSKTISDWDHLLQTLQSIDPHDRLRSVHNCHDIYDNARPWITHASIQDGAAVLDDSRAEMLRDVWRKPVIFDEVRYEGDVVQRWGNLKPQELVERFWWGLIAGTYVGHGEAYAIDGSGADASWVGKGGTFHGESLARLAFLKQVMQDGPVPGFEPIDKWWDRHLGGQAGHYYLRYFGEAAPVSWMLDLPKAGLSGGEVFRAEILDTWNMAVSSVDGTFTMASKDNYNFHDPARPFLSLPGKPWQAVRLVRI